jgi:hypothetical protein
MTVDFDTRLCIIARNSRMRSMVGRGLDVVVSVVYLKDRQCHKKDYYCEGCDTSRQEGQATQEETEVPFYFEQRI